LLFLAFYRQLFHWIGYGEGNKQGRKAAKKKIMLRSDNKKISKKFSYKVWFDQQYAATLQILASEI